MRVDQIGSSAATWVRACYLGLTKGVVTTKVSSRVATSAPDCPFGGVGQRRDDQLTPSPIPPHEAQGWHDPRTAAEPQPVRLSPGAGIA